jgi:hypothetical protein
MPDAVGDLVMLEIFVAPRDDGDVVAGIAIGTGQKRMHLLDRAAEHRRDRIERADDDGDAHVIGCRRGLELGAVNSLPRRFFRTAQPPLYNGQRDHCLGGKPL